MDPRTCDFPPLSLFSEPSTTPPLFASIWPLAGTAGVGVAFVLPPLLHLGMGALAAPFPLVFAVGLGGPPAGGGMEREADLAVQVGGRLSDLDHPVLSCLAPVKLGASDLPCSVLRDQDSNVSLWWWSLLALMVIRD